MLVHKNRPHLDHKNKSDIIDALKKEINVDIKKAAFIIAGTLIGVTALVLFQWHQYVTNKESPYDEVGIELNRYMPAPMQKWGCAQLKETFGNKALPPYGCADETGRAWR